jgi:hypothetical protein
MVHNIDNDKSAVVYMKNQWTIAQLMSIRHNYQQRNRFRAKTSIEFIASIFRNSNEQSGGTNIIATGDWHSIAMWGKAFVRGWEWIGSGTAGGF